MQVWRVTSGLRPLFPGLLCHDPALRVMSESLLPSPGHAISGSTWHLCGTGVIWGILSEPIRSAPGSASSFLTSFPNLVGHLLTLGVIAGPSAPTLGPVCPLATRVSCSDVVCHPFVSSAGLLWRPRTEAPEGNDSSPDILTRKAKSTETEESSAPNTE